MAAQKYACRLNSAAQRIDCGVKTRLVPSGGPQRRPSGALLAERQIAAQNGNPGAREGLGQDDQQRRLAIRSRGMGQYESRRDRCRRIRRVQEPPNRLGSGSVGERLNGGHNDAPGVATGYSRNFPISQMCPNGSLTEPCSIRRIGAGPVVGWTCSCTSLRRRAPAAMA